MLDRSQKLTNNQKKKKERNLKNIQAKSYQLLKFFYVDFGLLLRYC